MSAISRPALSGQHSLQNLHQQMKPKAQTCNDYLKTAKKVVRYLFYLTGLFLVPYVAPALIHSGLAPLGYMLWTLWGADLVLASIDLSRFIYRGFIK